MKTAILTIFLFLLSNHLFALGNKGPMACKNRDKKQKDYKCGQCEQDLLDEVNDLIGKIEAKPGDYDSIEDVLSGLPEKMRANTVFMGMSRSLQEGDRYLMKSPGSEIVASFNGHPETRGGNNIEFMQFNGKTGTFDFIDIQVKDGKAKVTKNPRKCVRCHGRGDRARPIFDPYRFWFNQVPSSGDTVTKGTQEEKDFLEYLEKIENKDNKPEWRRFGHLKPYLDLNPIADVKAGLKKDGYYHVKSTPEIPGSTSSPSDGPGVRMFDEMYLNNHCRINNLLQNDPNFETFKYAMAAAAKNSGGRHGEKCFRKDEDFDKFMPAKVREKSKEYFTKRGIAKGPKDNVFGKIEEHTERKQADYFKDRVGRKLWMLEERFRKEDPKLSEEEAYQKARREIETVSKIAGSNFNGDNFINDKEESVGLVAPMRYILEPLGVNTSDFSTSYDPGSYTFGDFIFNMANFEPLLSLTKMSCDELAKRSMAAFLAKQNDVVDKISTQCENFDPIDKDLGELEDIFDKVDEKARLAERKRLRPKMRELFNDYYCLQCHEQGDGSGAPDLPLDENEMDEFDALMDKTAGELGDMRKRIWSRINRQESDHGAMPPGEALTVEEKKLFKSYLETFSGKRRKDKDKLRLDENGRRQVISP